MLQPHYITTCTTTIRTTSPRDPHHIPTILPPDSRLYNYYHFYQIHPNSIINMRLPLTFACMLGLVALCFQSTTARPIAYRVPSAVRTSLTTAVRRPCKVKFRRDGSIRKIKGCGAATADILAAAKQIHWSAKTASAATPTGAHLSTAVRCKVKLRRNGSLRKIKGCTGAEAAAIIAAFARQLHLPHS